MKHHLWMTIPLTILGSEGETLRLSPSIEMEVGKMFGTARLEDNFKQHSMSPYFSRGLLKQFVQEQFGFE
jgi:hypothetical protein